MKNSVFLDTSFSLAIAIPKDANHKRAIEISRTLANSRTEIITTQAIVLEIGNALSGAKHRPFAVQIISRLQEEPNISIVSISDELIDKAFELFSDRADKEWGMIDCVSFVVMREYGLNSALTADAHFVQAGFRALLRED